MLRQFISTVTIFGALLAGTYAAAATLPPVGPAISGITANAARTSLTINGKGFGQMNGSIVTWDDFEAQTANTQILGKTPLIGPKYTTLITNNAGAAFSAVKSHSGSQSAKIDWVASGARIASFGWSAQGPFNQLYISYWRYMETAESPLLTTTNHKQFYLYGNDTSQGYQLPQAMPVIPQGTQNWGYYNNNSTSQGTWSATNNLNTAGRTWASTTNQWNRWEFWQKLNSDPACTINTNCDGEVKYWIDAALAYSRNDYKHRFVNGQYVDFKLGMMHGPTTVPASVYFDDLYIASTQARVEIGDSPTWSACTHREIQVPQAWVDGQIQVSLNLGSFKNTPSVYVFVIDSTGVVSASCQLPLDTMNSYPAPSVPGTTAPTKM
jgi:hypothetical protein